MSKKLFLTITLLTFLVVQSFSQSINNYGFTANSGTFSQIAGTAPAPAPTNGFYPAIDDGFWNNIPIGFDFYYMGTRYASISASTNGWLTFNTLLTDDAYENSLSGGGNAVRPIIAPLWDDLIMELPTSGSYITTGTTPNKVFTFQYLNVKWGADGASSAISFQVKLYESTGKIEFIYRPEAGTVVSPSASIGITASGTEPVNFISVNNSGTLNPTEASVTDIPTQTYSFTPPTPIAPTSLTFSNVTNTSATLNWQDNSTNETGFVIYRSTDGTNYSFISQTAANATSSVQAGLTEGTLYYWQVQAITEGGLSSTLSGSQATTSGCTPPTTSAAGANQTGASTCGLTTVTLAANAPSVGTGAWSIVSGAGGTVTTPTSPASTFSGTAGTSYTLRWTISNNPCTASTSDVTVTFNQNPGISGVSTATCVGGSTGTITATGTGSLDPLPYRLNAGTYQASSTFTGLAAANHTLYIKSSTGCISSTSVVVSPFANSPDVQTTAGTNTWIGHMYDGINFQNYIGRFTEAETFNELFGGNYTCFNVTSSNVARSIYTESFSVKFRMNATKKGLYVVDLGSDDGSRLTVDGAMVYNNWSDQGFSTKPRVLMNLTGTSSLLYEFYEAGGANQVVFQNLTLVLANNLTTNTTQTISIGSTGLAIGGDVYGALPTGINLSGTGYQWHYSTTAGGARIPIAGATGATYTPSATGAPFNEAGTYYIYRNAVLSSANNVSPNPSVATNESTGATLTVLAAPSATISYIGTPFCTTSGVGSVTHTGTGGGTYTSTAGLTIDAGTGAITPATSTAGSYTVTYTIAASGESSEEAATTSILINQPPTTSVAGANQTGASTCGLTSVTLAANAPTIGTGAWSIISGAGGTVTTPTSPTSTFSGTAGTSYTLRWTISNNPCTASTSDVTVTFNQNPGISGVSTATCVGGSTGTITATGTGSLDPLPYRLNAGTYQASSTFTGLAAANHTLYIKSSTGCISSTSVVVSPFANSPDVQTTAGTNTWIGHMYDGLNFESYIGQFTEAETFDESFGGSYTCFNVTSSNVARSIFTEQFSVKFRMNATKKGLYIVDLGSDDGSRLTVDGSMVYNHWVDHAFASIPKVLLNLSGTSSLLYEFNENTVGNQVVFQNLTLVLANNLAINTTQTICSGTTGTAISGDVYGALPTGINLSGTGYQWYYSTTAGGARILIAGATGATYTPSAIGAPFNEAGTYYIYRNAVLSSTNNFSPNPYVATNESNAATIIITVTKPVITQIPSANLVANYRLDGDATDATGINHGILQNTPAQVTDRFNIAGKAYNFNGSSQYISTTNSFSNPGNFTISIWFKTSTTTGGKLIGFGNASTGLSGSYDRHLYMNNAGQIYFGVYPAYIATVNSALSYNDGTWHLATASLSSATGMVLYVDGIQAGSNASVTAAENFTGYWRIGYDNMSFWPDAPTSSYFNGSLDDALIYHTALTPAQVAVLYKSPDGAGNNGPVCIGSTISLNSTTVSGASYSWTGPNNFTSLLQNPSFVYGTINAGLYTVNVNVSGCVSSAYTSVTPGTTGQWTGNLGSDWTMAENWCSGQVSGPADNVIIAAGAAAYPIVTSGTTVAARDVTIQNGGSLTLAGGTIQVAGAINNAGTFDASAGTIEMNGTVAQNIAGSMFVAQTIKNLTVSNATSPAGIIVTPAGGKLNITGTLKFGVSNATLNTNDTLVLKSTAGSTAMVAALPVNITTGAATSFISGKVTVERYIPANRAWRMLTSPLSGTGNIFNSWQNGGVYTPGKGTLVTGPTLEGNGLDPSALNTVSMKSYNATTPGGWVNIINTNTTLLSNETTTAANMGYFIFVRGDRNPINTSGFDSNSTTLSSKGFLQTGIQAFAAENSKPAGTVNLPYTIIGNPYASPIDFSKITRAGGIRNSFWTWDPLLNKVGGYVVLSDAGSGTYSVSPSSSAQRQIIQSGQAFFVVTDNGVTGTAAALTYNETNKSTAPSTNIGFRPAPTVRSVDVILNLLNRDGSTAGADGLLAEFNENFDDAVNTQDAAKFGNVNETFSLLRYGTSLAIERRPMIVSTDTLFFKLLKSTASKYQFVIKINNLAAPALVAFLEDSYTRIATPLLMDGSTTFNFNIDGSAASFNSERFRIVFKQAQVLPVTFTNVTARQKNNDIVVEWKVEQQLNIQHYEIQKSADGSNFVTEGIQSVTGTNTSTYNWTDVKAVSGDNYYRIRNVDHDGSFAYSKVVKVNIATSLGEVTVYPNPVADKIIRVQFKNLPAGKYTLRLVSLAGEVLLLKEIVHAGGNSSPKIVLPAYIAKGMVRLEVVNPGKSTIKRINVLHL